MANKKEFPKDFIIKSNIKKSDVILIADSATRDNYITTVDALTSDKVDKASGKSLVSDIAIDKLNSLPTNTELNNTLSNKVDKASGKSLLDNTAIDKLNALPTNAGLNTKLDTKVDKVEGKALSANDYNNVDKSKVDLIKTAGDDNKFLAETGEYRTVIAPIQSISVNGEEVEIVDGNVAVVIPDAPVQSIEVNGTDVAPDSAGKVSIEIPKAPVQSVSVNGEDKAPDSAGNIDLFINVNVEQTVNPLSDDPISSSAVASEFAGLSAKYGASLSLSTIGDEEDKKYSISLLDENGNIISTTDEFSGGGSGEVSTTKIVLTKLTENATIKKGDDVDISFFYDHLDVTSQSSTGNPAKVTVSIISGALNTTKELNINAGTVTKIDVKDNLQLGNNTVRLRIEVDNGDSTQVSTISWSIQVVNLVLSSNYEFATAINKGTTIFIPFTLQGAGTKILSCYVNGAKIEDKSISTSSSTGSFTIPTGAYNHGNVSVQLVAELELLTGNIKSNSVYYDLIVVEENRTAPIIGAKYIYQDGTLIETNQRPYLSARQFEDYTLNYAVYDPLRAQKVVTVTVDNVVISNTSISFIQQKLVNRSIKTGDLNATIKTGNVTYTLGVKVSSSSIGLVEPSDNLIFKFSALGKTNNDLGEEIWESSNTAIKATLSGVKFGGDGWLDNGLRLSDAGRAVINYQPLNASNRLINNSFTFQIKFRNTEVTDDTVEVIKCVDSEGTGFVITPTEAKMTTKGKADVSMKLASGEVYNIAFVSYPTAQLDSSDHEKLNNNMVFLYINGIMSGAVQRANADVIYQNIPTNITIGANGATTDIYGIRHYNRYLNDSEALDMYLIDIDNVDDLISKYNFNAQIDGNGNVTVDDVPEDMRYMIITGEQANGQSTVKYAQVQNNKDTRYDVVEILHIKKSQPSLNFKLIGGCIRLQGTSSLAYPIKNFRFYFKNSAKVAGQLFTGVDAQGNGGVLQAKAKFSFKLPNDKGKVPAPVDVWCAKADYAESSSSHNTGMAKLANDVLVASGDLTPAQKYVAPTYKYDVRTTVDGEPCYIFYRNTLESTPVFVGKFNLNNDKSTENVFGFLDIPGYHVLTDGVTPSTWVTEKFAGKNPTECWEFLNNDYPMGSYLDDDFDAKIDVDGVLIPNWTRVFEARFPDNQSSYMDGTKKPTYLESFVKWVKSTQNNGTKFKNELSNYADVNYLCDYYMFTDIFAAVDQRVKNQMMGFWYSPEADKMLAYFIFYDNDTIMGVRNDGRLKYHWDIDHNSIDEEITSSTGITKYAFEGHNSILWKNLREQFAPELEASFKRLRSKMTNEYILNAFGKEQTEKFAERIYNIDAQLKYVLPKTLGVEVIVNGQPSTLTYSYLESMQGNRTPHRKWWLTNRLNLFDGKYSAGDYGNTSITWKGFSQAGAKVKATPSRDYYFQLRRESTVMTHSKVTKGVEWSYTYDQTANIGTIFTLLGGVFMSKLNLSEWGGFTDLNLPKLPLLDTLILGGAVGKTYSLTELDLGDKLPMMKTLDVRNYTNIPSLDVTGCKRLEEINARGCSILTSINFAVGSPISKLILPNNLNTLKLNSFSNLTNANITFPDGNKVETLVVDNCPLINWELLFNSMSTTLKNIRITGIVKTGTVDWLLQFINIGGIDENGTLTNTCSLVGTYQLTKFIPDEQYNQLVSHFPELVISQPVMSVVKFNTNVADPKNITNIDNNTGYGTGTEYVPNGHVSMILNKRYRCLGKQTATGQMLITPLDNTDGRLFKNKQDATAYQTGAHGDVYVYEPAYWYKGVNDFKNNANYACYSSNTEKPKAYEGRTLILNKETFSTVAGRENAPIPVSYRENTNLLNSSQYSQLTNFLNTQSGYFVYGMKVEGFKQIRFPAITSDTIISAIVTDGAELTSQVFGTGLKINGLNVPFSNGMYYVIDIPSNAKWVFITFTNADTFDKVVLTESTNILDVEPDWIEHKESLVSAFDVSYFTKQNGDNILKSYPSNKLVVNNLSFETFNNYIGDLGRKLQMADYEEYKNVTNLFYAKFGNRNSQLQNGYGQNSFGRTGTGSTLKFGMQDSALNTASGNLEFCVFNVKNSDGTITKVVNNEISCMGYEDLYGGVNEWFAGISTVGNYKVALLDSNGYSRQLRGYQLQNGQYPQVMHNGLYLDIIPCGTTTAGTDSTYYCDTVNVSNTAGYIGIRGGQSGQTRVDAGIVNYTLTYTPTQTISTVGARLMFRGGTIIKTENVVTFINASEIA